MKVLGVFLIVASIISVIFAITHGYASNQDEVKGFIEEAKSRYWAAMFANAVLILLAFTGIIINHVIDDDTRFKFDRLLDFDAIFNSETITIWLSIFVILIVFIVLIFGYKNAEQNVIDAFDDYVKAKQKRDEEERHRIEAIRREIDSKNNAELGEVLKVLPSFDKMIAIDNDDKKGYIGYKKAFYVSIRNKTIMANNRVIAFSDIIHCELDDDKQTVYNQVGSSKSETTSDAGSMVGRAIVGGLIAGGTGAIIGGATGKKETSTTINTTTTTHISHDYTVVINVRDIVEPLCKIHCGENEKAAKEIVGTINAIIQ